MDFKLEVIVVPVSDVDRAKAFYSEQVGFTLDHDTRISDGMRIVQLTPPGSGCSIVIGTGLAVEMAPGALQGVQLVVDDIEAARAELTAGGVAVSEVVQMGPEGMDGSRFVFFKDPDGNGWGVQEYKGSPVQHPGADA